jgi:hypothetical protein
MRHATIAVLSVTIAFAAACGTPPAEAPEGAAPAAADGGKVAPIFEVDPYWPKPLPNHWVTGSTIGLSIDDQDRVWTIHRPNTVEANFKAADIMANQAVDYGVRVGAADQASGSDPIGQCCKVAPPILVYDAAGALVSSWGGPGEGYDWPDSNHGITVDAKGNVWLGGNGAKDTQVLKFTGAGQFLLQIGTHGVHNGSNDTANLWQPTKIFHEPTANEVYISDGYGNRRVIVFDADTGAYKRHWGAYGQRPDDGPMPPYNPSAPPSKQFSTSHCVVVSNDGLVYVCDRVNDRIQVFQKDWKFVREANVSPTTTGEGSEWDHALSRDPKQQFVYVADGPDKKNLVLRRDTLADVSSICQGGRLPGTFYAVGSVAVDSKGNVYTGETSDGKRVQKFMYQGMGPAPTQ